MSDPLTGDLKFLRVLKSEGMVELKTMKNKEGYSQ
jgi:hypothetical protein